MAGQGSRHYYFVLLAVELLIVNLTPTNVPISLLIKLSWSGTRYRFSLLSCTRSRRSTSSRQLRRFLLTWPSSPPWFTSPAALTHSTTVFTRWSSLLRPLLPRYWAYLTAAVSFILFGATLELTYFGKIPSYFSGRGDLKSLQAIILIGRRGQVVDGVDRLVDEVGLGDVEVERDELGVADVRNVLERARLEVVDADHTVPPREQLVAQMRAEESGAPGDQAGAIAGSLPSGVVRSLPGACRRGSRGGYPSARWRRRQRRGARRSRRSSGRTDPRRFTDSGIEVERGLRAPSAGGRALEDPGEFPYTRGIRRDGYRARLWTMRQYAGYASASESNERYRYLLAHGSTGLSMAFDLPTQLGLDSDDPRALGEVGRTGRRDRHDRRHADRVRRDPARRGVDVDDDQRSRERAAVPLRAGRRGAGRGRRGSCAARARTTSSRSTSRAATTSTRPGRRCG